MTESLGFNLLLGSCGAATVTLVALGADFQKLQDDVVAIVNLFM